MIDTILGILAVLFVLICVIIARIIWLLAMQLEPAFKDWVREMIPQNHDRKDTNEDR